MGVLGIHEHVMGWSSGGVSDPGTQRVCPGTGCANQICTYEDESARPVVEHEGGRLHRLPIPLRRLGAAQVPHEVDAERRCDRDRGRARQQ